jgi:ubiquinone biosynthesis protein COQ4
MKWKSLRRAIQMYRNKGPIGDMALLKADAFGVRGTRETESRLDAVRGHAPPLDLEALRDLPEGTLGREYARLLDLGGYEPFTVSPAIEPDLLARNAFAYRLQITHDMFHVLTGFDTSYAGEIGVLAFTTAQDYTHVQRYLAMPLALLLYPLLAPRQIRAIYRCAWQGWRMGKRASFLIAERLEDWLARPVAELRAELGIELPARRTGPGYSPVATPA